MSCLWHQLLLTLAVTCTVCTHCQGEDCEADGAGFVQWNRFDRLKRSRAQQGSHHYNPPPSTKPNIFVIIIDDLGFNQVGYRAKQTGNMDVITPNIDDLAGRGIIMDRFYATPWCAPSRAALQTGRLDALNPNVANNIWNWDAGAIYDYEGQNYTTPFVGGIQPGTKTLGEKLSEHGYVSHLNGKWGIGGGAWANTPMGMGYSSFMGWFGDSMESCDGSEPGFAVGGSGPLMDTLPSFWRQDSKAIFEAPWCDLLRATKMLDAEELFVACRTFKAELKDVADEEIRRRSREIILQHDYEQAPLFLVHALQLMHLPMQYPEHFAPPTISATKPQNEDLRAATYGALTYVDWVIGDLINAFKEKKQYENTIVLVTSDNGGAIYAGTANNNFPLRGGKFNNFEGGQRVNAFFSGGWVEAALAAKSLSPFTSETVMAINDVPETLLHMVGIKHVMGHASGPLTGVALWHKILHKEQHERRIAYSETMQLIVTPNVQDLRKFWFLGKTKVISDGHWSANFPNNTEFIPDFGYFYVRPCGSNYCYFNLSADPSEQTSIGLSPVEVDALRRECSDAWNNNVINTSRIESIENSSNGYPSQVALWTHYGASGPFLTKNAEPVEVSAQCWCDWIDDEVPPENVTHIIFNLYLGARCTDIDGARCVDGALECKGPLRLTQAPIPWSFQEGMWSKIGFRTENFSYIEKAQWDWGPARDDFPLPLMKWNLPVIHGLQSMNARIGFKNWANIAKYPFNLAIHDHCPEFRIYTAPTPTTQVTDWLLAAGVFDDPTRGVRSGGKLLTKVLKVLEFLNITDDGKVRGCIFVKPDGMVCPTLDNKPPLIDTSDVKIRNITNCLDECILYDPHAP